jgi:hypothetical protein
VKGVELVKARSRIDEERSGNDEEKNGMNKEEAQ